MRGLARWQPEPEEPNVDVDWEELTDFQKLNPDDGTAMERLFAIRVKSSSNDSEWLIHDPLDFMIQTLGRDHPDLGLNDDTRKSWRVTTFIVNHHNTLSGTHLKPTAVVIPEEQTIGLTMVKKRA